MEVMCEWSLCYCAPKVPVFNQFFNNFGLFLFQNLLAYGRLCSTYTACTMLKNEIETFVSKQQKFEIYIAYSSYTESTIVVTSNLFGLLGKIFWK